MRTFLVSGAAGAAAAYLADPVSGRTRRVVARDRGMALARRAGWRAGKLSRHAANKAEGIRARATMAKHADRPTDDVTVKQRIESEVLREMTRRRINVNVQHGVAELRGTVDDAAQIAALEEEVRRVAGVEDVNMVIHVGAPATERKRS